MCASTCEQVPTTPWFCDSCLTSQADGILEFLQQTRRILVERIDAAKMRSRDDTGDSESTNAVETADESADASARVALAAATADAAAPKELDASATGESETAPLADVPGAEVAESAAPENDNVVAGTTVRLCVIAMSMGGATLTELLLQS